MIERGNFWRLGSIDAKFLKSAAPSLHRASHQVGTNGISKKCYPSPPLMMQLEGGGGEANFPNQSVARKILPISA